VGEGDAPKTSPLPVGDAAGNPDKTKQRALDQLRQMGYEVTLSALPAASWGNLRVRSAQLE
jgi:hypothetical protein